jgi:lipoate-protein ligase A
LNTYPFFNLAAEAYFLSQLDCEKKDYVFVYVNQPAVVIGRNQNIYEEVNLLYCHEHQIDICRRISGGGTVYHDLGNINIAWFSKSDLSKVNSYTHAMQPLIDFLKGYNITAHLNERNSLMIGDKKIGGNAQFSSKKNLLSHCTLLFDSNLTQLEKSIAPNFEQVTSHAGKSVRSAVMNIKDLLASGITLQHFIEGMQDFFRSKNVEVLELNDDAIAEINNIHLPKLNHFDWVYARSPKSVIDCMLDKKPYKLFIEQAQLINVEGINIPEILSSGIGKSFTYLEQNELFEYLKKSLY